MKILKEFLPRIILMAVLIFGAVIATDEAMAYLETSEEKNITNETQKNKDMKYCLEKTENSAWCVRIILK